MYNMFVVLYKSFQNGQNCQVCWRKDKYQKLAMLSIVILWSWRLAGLMCQTKIVYSEDWCFVDFVMLVSIIFPKNSNPTTTEKTDIEWFC